MPDDDASREPRLYGPDNKPLPTRVPSSDKEPELAKQQKTAKTVTKTKRRISPLTVVLGTGTLIGGIAAVLALLPRVTVTVSDPVNPDDPFSSSAIVMNTGYIPLESVQAFIAMQDIIVWNTDHQMAIKGGANLGTRMSRVEWGKPNLGLDDKFAFPLNDIWAVSKDIFMSAEIAVIVDYEVPFIPHWKREKIFPLSTKRQSNGKFYWYAHPPQN